MIFYNVLSDKDLVSLLSKSKFCIFLNNSDITFSGVTDGLSTCAETLALATGIQPFDTLKYAFIQELTSFFLKWFNIDNIVIQTIKTSHDANGSVGFIINDEL